MTRYDDVAYEGAAILETHPARLRVFGRLFGLNPAPLASQRVLEIGCGSGGNLIALAATMPQTRFVGVDLATTAIASGQATIDALGLANVTLHAMDLRDLPAEPFDTILVHGVYSWVPDDVREALMAGLSRWLAPEGMAYVSYNALPGWRQRGAVRDLMRMQLGDDPMDGIGRARATLDLVAELAGSGAWGRTLEREARVVRSVGDWYLFHDHLAPHNHPVYFRDFVDHAARNGLQYLADAEKEADALLPPDAIRRLVGQAPDPLDFEQLVDFVTLRDFRCSLVVHADRPVRPVADLSALAGTWVSAALRVVEDGVFETLDGLRLQVSHPALRSVFTALARTWPAAIRYDDLATPAHHDLIATNLLDGFRGGFVRLSDLPFPGTPTPSTAPEAFAVARYEADLQSDVTTLLHVPAHLGPFERRLVRHLDGRPLGAVIDALLDDVARELLSMASTDGAPLPEALQREALTAAVGQRLPALARAGLLHR